MHHGLDPKLAARLARLTETIAETTAAALDQHGAQQAAAVEGVKADVAALRTVEDSTVTLILGLAEQQGQGQRPTAGDIATMATTLRATLEARRSAEPAATIREPDPEAPPR